MQEVILPQLKSFSLSECGLCINGNSSAIRQNSGCAEDRMRLCRTN